MKKTFLMVMVFLLLGCNDSQTWLGFDSAFKHVGKRSRPATIDRSEYRGGQLRIAGRCEDDGEILLVLPTTRGDDRIIGSPRCSHGRYELISSTFGRPPCEVVVDSRGGTSAKAKVIGTDIYCP